MKLVHWTRGAFVGVVLAASGAGCAAHQSPPADIRGSALVAGPEARPLVVGPMKLLHVNADSKARPTFSRAWVRNGTGDCRNGTPLEWNGTSDLQIANDELICVATVRPARFSWHGRSVSTESSDSLMQASLR
jgi:hypothetical protein